MAASPRYTTLLLVTLLVILNFSHAAKEAAGLRNQAVVQDNHGEVDEEAMGFTAADERCGGAGGEGEEEECLMRRTLVAHTDYIYTQGSHN